MSAYGDALLRRARNIVKMVRLANEHATVIAEIEAEIRQDEDLIRAVEHGVPADVAATGRQIIQITWANDHLATAETTRVFEDAIEDVRAGAPNLTRRYMGVKSYDRWISQRADCEYFMAPSHGSIWFRVGLVDPKGPALSEDVRIAVVAWLQAVQRDPAILTGVSA